MGDAYSNFGHTKLPINLSFTFFFFFLGGGGGGAVFQFPFSKFQEC